MNPSRTCSTCGSALPEGVSPKQCPACLIREALKVPGSGDETVKSPPRQPWAAPDVEELAPLFPSMEVLELIGRGGMGAVYRARQKSLERCVALKVLPSEGMEHPEFGERFLREAQALAGLSHPNIVGLHDFGRTVRGHWYFVMEYVDGPDLARIMRSEKLKPAAALALIPQICDALACAHEAGFIHRDIKPGNILVDKKGRVKVADFGLAKLTNRSAIDFTLTGEGAVLGTPRYMAPEQLEHPLEVDHRADIYALGVVFYEMLTGEVPQGHFQPPSEKAAVDPRLDEVVLRAMDREPSRRFQHVSEIKSGIEQAVRPRTALYRWRWPLGAAAALVTGAGAWMLWPREPQQTPTPPPVVLRENSLGQQFAPVPGTETSFCTRETRVQDWEAFCQDTGRTPPGAPFTQGADHPVVRVSAEEAVAFCEWLTKRERRDGRLAPDEFYRLPTDAEWSTAAGLPPETGATPEEKHAQRRGVYPWGERAPAPQGAGNYPDAALRAVQDGVRVIHAYYDGYARTAPAGSFSPNLYHLHDMGGNVWELTGTPFSANNKNPSARGGAWWPLEHDETWSGLRSGYRRSDLRATDPSADCGFRIVIAKREGDHRTRDLFADCREDRADEVRALLKAGASPLDTDADDHTPLITAARHGALESIRALLEHGVRIDAEDKAGNTALFHALYARQPDAALLLLEKGANGAWRNAFSQTPLHAAANAGTVVVLEKLPRKEGAVNEFDGGGYTPLHYAAERGHIPALEWLLAHGAKADAVSKSGFSPLHSAVATSQAEAARLLVKAGAPLDTKQSGATPLDSAAMMADAGLVRALLELKAPVSGTTARFAALSGSAEVFDMVLEAWQPTRQQVLDAKLLEAAACDIQDRVTSISRSVFPDPNTAKFFERHFQDRIAMREGRSALAIVRKVLAMSAPETAAKPPVSVASARPPVVSSDPPPPPPPDVGPLLDSPGIPVDNPTPGSMAALGYAAQGGLVDVMKLLLEAGADPNRADSAGFTPLHCAAERGRAEALQLLLEHGAWVEARTKDQRTALLLAAVEPGADALRVLMAKGADAEARDADGFTPLMSACLNGRVENVRVLLDAGAAINVFVTSQSHRAAGMGPVHFAACGRWLIDESHEELLKTEPAETKFLGSQHGADSEYLSILRLLLERGANPNAAQPGGITPLMGAAQANNTAALQFLLEHKALPDMPTAQGFTALHHAARKGAIPCLKLLLAAGAKTEIAPDIQFQSALHWAVDGDSAEAVEQLVKAGARVNATDSRRATALHWAASHSRKDALRALLAAGANLELPDLGHNTPLHMAAVGADVETVRLLVNAGAKLTPYNFQPATPAEVARRHGNKAVAEFLESEVRVRALQPPP
jgi:ankyrin repeat protein